MMVSVVKAFAEKYLGEDGKPVHQVLNTFNVEWMRLMRLVKT